MTFRRNRTHPATRNRPLVGFVGQQGTNEMILLKMRRRVRCTGCGAIGTEYQPFDQDGKPVLVEYGIHPTIARCACTGHVLDRNYIAHLESKFGEKIVLPNEEA